MKIKKTKKVLSNTNSNNLTKKSKHLKKSSKRNVKKGVKRTGKVGVKSRGKKSLKNTGKQGVKRTGKKGSKNKRSVGNKNTKKKLKKNILVGGYDNFGDYGFEYDSENDDQQNRYKYYEAQFNNMSTISSGNFIKQLRSDNINNDTYKGSFCFCKKGSNLNLEDDNIINADKVLVLLIFNGKNIKTGTQTHNGNDTEVSKVSTFFIVKENENSTNIYHTYHNENKLYLNIESINIHEILNKLQEKLNSDHSSNDNKFEIYKRVNLNLDRYYISRKPASKRIVFEDLKMTVRGNTESMNLKTEQTNPFALEMEQVNEPGVDLEKAIEGLHHVEPKSEAAAEKKLLETELESVILHKPKTITPILQEALKNNIKFALKNSKIARYVFTKEQNITEDKVLGSKLTQNREITHIDPIILPTVIPDKKDIIDTDVIKLDDCISDLPDMEKYDSNMKEENMKKGKVNRVNRIGIRHLASFVYKTLNTERRNQDNSMSNLFKLSLQDTESEIINDNNNLIYIIYKIGTNLFLYYHGEINKKIVIGRIKNVDEYYDEKTGNLKLKKILNNILSIKILKNTVTYKISNRNEINFFGIVIKKKPEE